MTKKNNLGLLVGGLAGAAALTAYVGVLRPRHLHWGATEEEARRRMPGDELVPGAAWGFNHAITINAPADKVWPWIVQVGYGRGGWYTYDRFYEMVGAASFVDGHSADRIIPELQDVKPGDKIQIFPNGPFTVAAIEPGRVLVLHASANLETGQPLDRSQPLPEKYLNASWAFYLEPGEAAPNATRLIARMRMAANPSPANMLAYALFMDLGSLFMQHRMLAAIKQRAEENAG